MIFVPMKKLFGALLLLSACNLGLDRNSNPGPGRNSWSDDALLPVLEAQEQRATADLCALLRSGSVDVRERAALAFASVQDSSGIPCLLHALRDSMPQVRATAVFALGFVADSLTMERMAQAALEEVDATVHRAYLSASFLAMQRLGMLRDPNAILYFLQSSSGHDKVRAADALRRLPDTTVAKMREELLELMDDGGTGVRQFLISALRKLGPEAPRAVLEQLAADTIRPNEQINALRVSAMLYPEDGAAGLLFAALAHPRAAVAALEALALLPVLDAALLLQHAEKVGPVRLKAGLLGLVFKHGDAGQVEQAASRLAALAGRALGPHDQAAVLEARAKSPAMETAELLGLMRKKDPAPVRLAAFQGAVQRVREQMMRSRYASPEAQYAGLREVVLAALGTGDAGLIAAAAELVLEEPAEAAALMLPLSAETEARKNLQPVRDLEALLLLDQIAARRDGSTPPAHRTPAFNHRIDVEALRALPQGQRYRIRTAKGDVVIATDVDQCPGSSLAFDSLVTSGYYNGKAFHRVVPNFVAQGGCPRGDGYGGMPWTLRTEIGRSPFTAGSVGLASAGRDTESCQFFITHSAAPHLDGRYTRFGEVVEGMDVVWLLQVGDVMEKVERVE
jgi:cyclophilin family peptidyl-prolyl cis-trans isomerase